LFSVVDLIAEKVGRRRKILEMFHRPGEFRLESGKHRRRFGGLRLLSSRHEKQRGEGPSQADFIFYLELLCSLYVGLPRNTPLYHLIIMIGG